MTNSPATTDIEYASACVKGNCLQTLSDSSSFKKQSNFWLQTWVTCTYCELFLEGNRKASNLKF